MKLVIEINEKEYRWIKEHEVVPLEYVRSVGEAIKNATPLLPEKCKDCLFKNTCRGKRC